MKKRMYFTYDYLDSTMQEYLRLKKIYPGLISVRAASQSDGVGRGDKYWLSPEGGLWFTFDLSISTLVPSFALYVGYCLHQFFTDTFAPLADKLKIKWTNDLMYDGKKLAGILCKSRSGHYIVGIGLNTNNSIDPLLGKYGAISLKEILECEVSNDEFCLNIIKSVEEHQKNLINPITYITYCNEHLFGKNQIATIDTGTGPFEAEILGLDLNGALIVQQNEGEPMNIHTGSILSVKAFS